MVTLSAAQLRALCLIREKTDVHQVSLSTSLIDDKAVNLTLVSESGKEIEVEMNEWGHVLNAG